MAACLPPVCLFRRVSRNVNQLPTAFAAALRPQTPVPNRNRHSRRALKTAAGSKEIPRFAFAFDIDGVLLRSSDPLPGASQSLSYLQSQSIPFILLTNGGGKHETERVHELSSKLHVPLSTSLFIQSHTPFASLSQYKSQTVLVVGGDGDKCRHVAHSYGFNNVLIPSDIYASDPTLWPFSAAHLPLHQSHAQPLPTPLPPIAAIFVFNDPRDWGLDLALITDLLLSRGGHLGTLSPHNGNPNLPNRGYQQDAQPHLWFSNPDLWWAAKHPLPRLGQGGFREALEGVWAAITGGPASGVTLQKRVIGKPHRETYEFAETRLEAHRDELFAGREGKGRLERVYMVGDNPESDIRGGNEFESSRGVQWETVLVRSGVYVEGTVPRWTPGCVVDGVWDAVGYGVGREGKRAGWEG